jgi:hypothetical protein
MDLPIPRTSGRRRTVPSPRHERTEDHVNPGEIEEDREELREVLVQLLEWQQAMMLLLKDILTELQEGDEEDEIPERGVPRIGRLRSRGALSHRLARRKRAQGWD